MADSPDLQPLSDNPARPSGWPWSRIAVGPDLTRASRAEPSLPRISLVTPSFNQGRYLEEAIRSVLLQDYPNLEYFVLDGGSTDDSSALIDHYRPWLDHARSAPDGGQSQAINEGLSRASGDILGWLNSDDLYQPGALAEVGRRLAGKSMALLVGTSFLTDGPDRQSGTVDARFPSFAEMLYEARSFPQPSVFWTRDLWQAAGPVDESLYFAMDYELWLRMLPLAKEIVRVDEGLSIARTHSEQKGQRAARDGDDERLVRQRVCSALGTAQRLGEPSWRWLAKVWARRAAAALKLRQPGMLRGALFHRAALRAVREKGYCSRR